MNYNSPSLELFGGVALIFLGVVFLIGFGLDPQDLVTDAIFLGFGALLVRNARRKSKGGPVDDGARRAQGKEKRNAQGSSKDRRRKDAV